MLAQRGGQGLPILLRQRAARGLRHDHRHGRGSRSASDIALANQGRGRVEAALLLVDPEQRRNGAGERDLRLYAGSGDRQLRRLARRFDERSRLGRLESHRRRIAAGGDRHGLAAGRESRAVELEVDGQGWLLPFAAQAHDQLGSPLRPGRTLQAQIGDRVDAVGGDGERRAGPEIVAAGHPVAEAFRLRHRGQSERRQHGQRAPRNERSHPIRISVPSAVPHRRHPPWLRPSRRACRRRDARASRTGRGS